MGYVRIYGFNFMQFVFSPVSDVTVVHLSMLPPTLVNSCLTVWCSGNALVLINAVALHRARLVLGWVTAFG